MDALDDGKVLAEALYRGCGQVCGLVHGRCASFTGGERMTGPHTVEQSVPAKNPATAKSQDSDPTGTGARPSAPRNPPMYLGANMFTQAGANRPNV